MAVAGRLSGVAGQKIAMPAKAAKGGARRNEATFAGFSKFLRQYVRVWPVLIACLIGPISKYLHLVQMYSAQENLAAGIAAVYGFLLAAALFYYRPALLRRALLRKLLPALLIMLSIASLLRYMVLLRESISQETDLASRLGVEASQLSSAEILARTGFQNIPHGSSLVAWYLAAFFAAESAVIVLALLEYVKSRR